MKKIVYLALLLVCFIPFSLAFANDTDLYILTQLMQQVPPDALILLDLSGSMVWTPDGSASYNLYYDQGPCTGWTNNCGDNNLPHYQTNTSPHTSLCTGSGAKYSSGSSACSTGPWYTNSGSGHNYNCISHGYSVPSTLYIDHGTCTSWTYNCGGTNSPYYTTNASPHTASCSFNSTDTIYGDPTCAGPFYKTYNYTGTSASQNVCTQSKIAIAKRALFKLFDVDNGSGTGTSDGIIDSNDQNYLKIRMGYMRYYNCGSSDPEDTTYPETSTSSYSSGCNKKNYDFNTAYNTIYCNSTSCTPTSSGSGTCIANENASGGTPLANALLEAQYYLNYSKASDVDAACRQKFVILITDGDDTYACGNNGSEGQTIQYKGRRETVAQARALANAGYYVFVVGFGSNMPYYLTNTLNWAAYYGKTKNTTQSQSTPSGYTIPYGKIYPSGVTQCMTSSTTSDGSFGSYGTHYYATTNDPGQYTMSGYAFTATNESELNAAIADIRTFILALIAESTSYVAPVVPISQFQSTNSENRLYLGMFKPTTTTMWKGNIKKFGIASTATSTIQVGDIIDVNGNLALNNNASSIKDSAQSYWSTSADGGDVEKGGLGAVLLASGIDSRNIYTYLGTNTSMTNSVNAFIKTNTAITTALLGVSTATDKNNVIDFIHGWDVYSWSTGPGTKRDWILGAFVHSRPVVIHYGSQDVIYAGANDGMLHAFNDADGTELWAFIPPDLLPNLKNFGNQLLSLQISVDGTPKAYINYNYNSDGSIESVNQAILIFGERRGGSYYYALDVTNPSSPVFLWSISPTQIRYGTTTTASTAYQELGQSWSTPYIGKIKNGSGTKWMAFISGGYDTNQDNATPGSDGHGRAVYVIDITNGSQIWKYSYSNDSNMKYCIPSDITPIDTNGDGFIERIYVGDVGGEMWRFDIGNMNNTGSWTGQIIFKGSGKIFYPPDVTFETNIGSGTYNMLFFGTGDREKPNDTPATNSNWVTSRLYAIKDYDASPTTLTESNLVDVTSDVLQSSSATQTTKTNVLQSLKTGGGWYIQLNQSSGENPNPGEKCDAAPVVFGGVVYYTTFTPTPTNTQTVCTLGTGVGNIYALQYQTGNAAFDLNDDTSITVGDRSTNIGSGIPSGIVIAIINGTITGYGGIAGGVFSPQLKATNSIIPLDWRIVF